MMLFLLQSALIRYQRSVASGFRSSGGSETGEEVGDLQNCISRALPSANSEIPTSLAFT